jgi:hypothetical protein
MTMPKLRGLKASYRLLGMSLGVATLLLIGAGIISQGLPTPIQPARADEVDEVTQQAMVDAINDEYRARAYYQAVIDKFGAVYPFSNVVQAEERHVQLWEGLFAQSGLPVPEDPFAGKITAPDTLLEACQAGVDAEQADAEMYGNFLTTIDDPNLQAVFTRLRQVSLENHLTAFESCVANDGLPCLQPGRGQGPQSRRGQGRR